MISSLLIKPAGADCNMGCSYCFYKRAAGLYPDTPHPRMSPEVLRELVGQYMELSWHASCHPEEGASPTKDLGPSPADASVRAAQGDNTGAQGDKAPAQAAFCWQGGEPTLMGLDFYRQVVAFQQALGHSGQIVGNSLQTNGLLLTDEWARFLARYRFLIGLSLDGPPEIHDHYRVNLGGQPTHAQVVRAWHTLQRAGVETNLLCMVTSHSADQAGLILGALYDLGARFMQFIPCLEAHPLTGELLPYTVTPEQYGDFLCQLFDHWLPHRHEVSIRFFDDVVSRLAGHNNLVSCEFRPRCGEYLVVEHNGDLYACDFFVDREHRLGNITTDSLAEVAAGEALDHFAAAKGCYSNRCRDCEWLDFCLGGCPKHRLFPEGTLGSPTYLCESYRRFFAHALPLLREVANECLEAAKDAPSGGD